MIYPQSTLRQRDLSGKLRLPGYAVDIVNMNCSLSGGNDTESDFTRFWTCVESPLCWHSCSINFCWLYSLFSNKQRCMESYECYRSNGRADWPSSSWQPLFGPSEPPHLYLICRPQNQTIREYWFALSGSRTHYCMVLWSGSCRVDGVCRASKFFVICHNLYSLSPAVSLR
jgi:hypothetical protein